MIYLPHRCYHNYFKLFNLELPNQWLWEIIDKFIHQFQAFSQPQFMSMLGKKTDEEIDILKSDPEVIEDKTMPLSLKLICRFGMCTPY